MFDDVFSTVLSDIEASVGRDPRSRRVYEGDGCGSARAVRMRAVRLAIVNKKLLCVFKKLG